MFIHRFLLGIACLLATGPALAGVLVSTVDGSPERVGIDASLQLNAGNPVISYQDLTNQDLKLATCIANCKTAAPTWQVVTVASEGTVGLYTSLQLNGGKPVISYLDMQQGALRLATCTADCASATPTWRIVTVDNVLTGHTSLQLNAGNPVISYYDYTNGRLKLATCTANCASASPTWQVVTVDGASGAGQYSSLQLNAGSPVISYLDLASRQVKLATCKADCATASPSWEIVVVDAGPLSPDTRTSLLLSGSTPVVSYNTWDSLRMAVCSADCASSAPTWQLATVETGAQLGRFRSLQPSLSGGIAISYSDEANGDLKLAVCVDTTCYSSNPVWEVIVVASEPHVGQYNSLQRDGFDWVVSFHDLTNGDLKLAVITTPLGGTLAFEPARRLRNVDPGPGSASRPSMRIFLGRPVVLHPGATGLEMDTCVADCYTADPRWVKATVDAAANGAAGSLQLWSGQPLASYTVNGMLVVATCTDKCDTANPTWVKTTVEAAGVGDHVLGMDGSTPVVAYAHGGNTVKYARCTADCRTASATWVRSTIHTGTDVRHLQLQLYAGRPDASFSDSSRLKLATCTAACDSAAPSWLVRSVDPSAVVSTPHSLDTTHSSPQLAYRDDQAAELRIAACQSDCATASPGWTYRSVDAAGDLGSGPSLLSYGPGTPIVSYYDATRSKLKLAIWHEQCCGKPSAFRYATIDAGGVGGASTSMQLHGRVPMIAYGGPASLRLAIVALGPVVAEISTTFMDFGYLPMGTSSPGRTITVTNGGGETLVFANILTSGNVTRSGSDCAKLVPFASCTIVVSVEAPVVPGATLNSTYWAGGDLRLLGVDYGPFTTNLAAVAVQAASEKSLVGHYYQSILGRLPDFGGREFWRAETLRVVGLGASVNETWFAMAQQFVFSPEYTALGRNDTAFVTDLYRTFFNRTADSSGLAYWVGNLAQGMPREVLLASFMFSPEFKAFAQAIFGATPARAEVDTVVDFYRGLLARTPDDGGFAYWVGRFRNAQCLGPAAVLAEVEAISSAFTLSPEYVARNRTNAQYVGDLYNAFLRRGGDLPGVQFWIGEIQGGARTRERVRADFRNSAEFQARVNAIVTQGCFQGP